MDFLEAAHKIDLPEPLSPTVVVGTLTKILVTPDDSKICTATSFQVSQRLVGKWIQFSGFHVLFELLVPLFSFKLGEPSTKLRQPIRR